MHGDVPQGNGARRIDSSSFPPVEGELLPPSEGNRQSLCPAKLAVFTWFTQSHTVVLAPPPNGSTLQVPLPHTLQPCVPPSDPATQVAAAAAFG